MGLFPTYIEQNVELKAVEKHAVPKEYEIDFKSGQLTGRIVEGKEAIQVWVWLALQIPRYRHSIYSWDYGNEFEELIGQGYTEEYIEAEAKRMTSDCLLINKNIQSITGFSVSMENSSLTISFTANTIYGSIEFLDQAVARPEAV
jgi:hypothetical protein